MRICKECQEAMVELMLSESGSRWAIVIRENENTPALGQVKCSVCPKCGEISLHLDELSKLHKYIEKRK